MATDTTLVQGAYDANKYRGQAVDTAQRRLGDNLNEAVGKIAANKRKEEEAAAVDGTVPQEKSQEELAQEELNSETDDNALEVANKEGGLENNDYNTVKDVVSDEWRLEYISATPEEQTALMASLNDTTTQMSSLVDSRKNLATEWGDRNIKGGKTGSGISAGVTSSDEAWVNQFLDGDKPTVITRKTKDKDGKTKTEFGVENKDGEFITMEKANSYIESLNVDVNAFEELRNITEQSSGLVANQDESIGFDKEKATRDIKGIIKSGNTRSLMYDSNFDDTSFIEDLEKGGFNIKYTDLGLEPPAGDEDGEFNPQDNLNEEDKQSVINAFVDKKELSTPLLEAYFVQHTENRWNQAYKQKHNKDWGVPVSGDGLITPGGDNNQQPSPDEISNAEVASI